MAVKTIVDFIPDDTSLFIWVRRKAQKIKKDNFNDVFLIFAESIIDQFSLDEIDQRLKFLDEYTNLFKTSRWNMYKSEIEKAEYKVKDMIKERP